MIEVHAKNAQSSEGKTRIEEMATLKGVRLSSSNRQVALAIGAILVVIAYLRSLWSPEPVKAQETSLPMPQPEDDQAYLLSEATGWNLEDEEVRAISRLDSELDNRLDDVVQNGPLANFRPSGSAELLGGILRNETLQPISTKPVVFDDQPPIISDQLGALGRGPSSIGTGNQPGVVAPTTTGESSAQNLEEEETAADDDQLANIDDEVLFEEDNPHGDNDGDDCAHDADEPENDQDNPSVGEHCSEDEGAPECNEDVGSVSQNSESENVCEVEEATLDEDPVDCEGAWATCEDSSCTFELPDFVEYVLASSADTASGSSGSTIGDQVAGGAEDEMFIGSMGADDVSGGEGDDVAIGGDGNDSLTGGDGADLVMGNAADDLLSGGTGNDLILGGKGSDTLAGDSGDDRLAGEGGDDMLFDGTGYDVLLGGSGNDTIVLAADSMVDLVDGGAGFDRLSLAAARQSTRIDFAAGSVDIDGGPSDRFEGIEGVVASEGLDEFDFSGFMQSNAKTDGPKFFQINNFGSGDRLRISDEFKLGFDEFINDNNWSRPEAPVSEMEMRINQASVDSADAASTRLSFRTLAEEAMLTRVIELDLDGDGRIDFEIKVSAYDTEQHDLIAQA